MADSTEESPAQPAYVFRGHAAQIHAVRFLRDNLRLLSGDADGWVILWSLPTKRPVAVWRAHSTTILGLGGWANDKIITHGRDNKLYVWQLRETDEANLSTVLPMTDSSDGRAQPWLLHSLDVNALNFCSFAQCADELPEADRDGLLLGTPGVQDGHINLTSLPSTERIATIPSPKDTSTGMLMALVLHFDARELVVIAGYESGHACVWRQQGHTSRAWKLMYLHKYHDQPILSVDAAPNLGSFFSSSADAVVARYPFTRTGAVLKTTQTRHAGQQGISVRDDGRILATAGWDGRVRVYSTRTMKELAVLKWHKEGCYAVAFAAVRKAEAADDDETKPGLTVSQRRTETASSTHWVAAGSKDGKVSLWEIY